MDQHSPAPHRTGAAAPGIFDYIVIGAGSAGATLAARLSEDPSVSVLLLEAGGRTHRNPMIRIPIGFLKAYRRPKFSVSFESEPEPGLGGRRLRSFRGRALGGSSTVNGMMYNRGNRLDYDYWRQDGNEGWSYDDVLPYFRKLESSWRGDTPYHGGKGPIGVKRVDDPIMLYENFEQSAVTAGHPHSDDLFGDHTIGVSRLELSVGNGERANTARCYLDPASKRPNLIVRTHAPTQRIVITRGRATAVEYLHNGVPTISHAAREIVLSAGSYQSPHLLMLSGIGPGDHLREMGIAVQVDLPGVGSNLQEHPMFPMVWKANHANTFLNQLRLDRAARNALHWLINRGGPFTTTACHGIVYAKSRPELARPDIYLGATAIGLDANLWFPGLTRAPVHRFVNIVAINYPRSRGWVKLRSADPTAPPRIFYNMLSDPEDLAGLTAGFRIAREIYATPPQSDAVAAEAMPGPTVQTDAEIATYIRHMIALGEHPSGTCAMGIHDTAVVDPQLRVRGIDGLRVADASIMPTVTGGNINIPTIMIGEKAADLIKQTAGARK